MASNIDPTKPADGVLAVKSELRANLAAAKSEIEALQAAGAGTFIGLTDTPSSYSGHGLKGVRVNAGATALEFAALAAGSGNLPSVKDYGALGNSNGTTGNGNDDTAEIQAALDANSGNVFLPPGIYRITGTLHLTNDGSGLVGAGRDVSLLFADGIAGSTPNIGDGAAIRTSPSDVGFTYNVTLRDFGVMGTCYTGIACRYSQGANLYNLAVAPSTVCQDAFFFSNTWGGSHINLTTNTAFIDQDSGAAFNIYHDYQGNYGAMWYMGGGSRPFYGIWQHGNNCYANTYDAPIVQGCRYGVYIQKSAGSVMLNGIYSENVVGIVRLGNIATGDAARGVTIVGSSFGGPQTDHPYYSSRTAVIELNNCQGVMIQGCNFLGGGAVGGLDDIQFHTAVNVVLAGNYSSVGGGTYDMTGAIKKVAGAGGGSFTIMQSAAPYGQGQLILKEDTAYGFKHWKMTVGSDGAWDAVAWDPAAAT